MKSSISEQTERAWSRRRVLGGVLIGGGSARMGQTKSLLRYQEQTFVELVIKVLNERTEQVVLLGEGQTPEVPPETVRLPDAPGLTGPLAGILAALRWQRDACWIVVACDLPLLRVEAIDWLLEDLVASGRCSPRHLEGHPAVHTPTPPQDLHACWTNVNTPEDFDRLGP